MSLSLERELRNLMKTGKYYLGTKQALKALKHGRAKLVIIAENMPPDVRAQVEYYAKLAGVPVIVYKGSSQALGLVAGKPFKVGVITVVAEGQSRILDLA